LDGDPLSLRDAEQRRDPFEWAGRLAGPAVREGSARGGGDALPAVAGRARVRPRRRVLPLATRDDLADHARRERVRPRDPSRARRAGRRARVRPWGRLRIRAARGDRRVGLERRYGLCGRSDRSVRKVGSYPGPGGVDGIEMAPEGFRSATNQLLIAIDKSSDPQAGFLLAMQPNGAVRRLLSLP